MRIIPAIDIINGQSVRLKQGDYDASQVMQRSPFEAIAFYQQYEQVERIHIVDLIGAKNEQATEQSLIAELRKASRLPMQIGGGLRDLATLQHYDALGIDYFILGTRAIVDLTWLHEMVDLFPQRIIVGIDAKGEDIYINGWTQASGRQIDEYLAEINPLDIAGIVYTDIAMDGMEMGPNFERTAQLQAATPHPVIASGGVRNWSDLQALEKLGIQQAIVGKAANGEAFWAELERESEGAN